MYKLGGDVTVIDGITNYGDVECKCKHYEGELADFVAQGIKFDYVIGRRISTFADDETEQKQMLSLVSKIGDQVLLLLQLKITKTCMQINVTLKNHLYYVLIKEMPLLYVKENGIKLIDKHGYKKTL